MLFKKEKFTLEKGQTEFDTKAYQCGVIDFQILELQTTKNKLMNEMQQLEKKGKEAREKLKVQEVKKTLTEEVAPIEAVA